MSEDPEAKAKSFLDEFAMHGLLGTGYVRVSASSDLPILCFFGHLPLYTFVSPIYFIIICSLSICKLQPCHTPSFGCRSSECAGCQRRAVLPHTARRTQTATSTACDKADLYLRGDYFFCFFRVARRNMSSALDTQIECSIYPDRASRNRAVWHILKVDAPAHARCRTCWSCVCMSSIDTFGFGFECVNS